MQAAEREVSQRKKVYRRLVYTKRMTQEKADYETAIMQAIADDYRRQHQPSMLDQPGE